MPQAENHLLRVYPEFSQRELPAYHNGTHVRWNERPNGGAAGPGRGMDPKRAMSRDAIQFEFGFLKGIFDFFCALKAFLRLEHIIGRLRAGCAGFFRVIEELVETLGAMLSAFDAGMKDSLGHR